ncbi:MAG: pirin family protein [Myxococcales bacterium]|nr:pirin family protein [Myxococcales bacterium]
MTELNRRDALGRLAAVGAAATAAGAVAGCARPEAQPIEATSAPAPQPTAAPADLVRRVRPLGAPPWPTLDPFLFCVHHDDAYPQGNADLGPAASLIDRQMGSDFEGIDGWRMYHGRKVPGFPSHPHRGFETVTVVRRGLVDHSDSLGATARYGDGDVQWLTAGDGIQHAEMFPLLRQDQPNPLELFQIWLNLPKADKRAPPHFTMIWRDKVPHIVATDPAGRTTEIEVVAGHLAGHPPPPPPPPRSWAARPDSDVAIWTLRLAPGAAWTLPAAQPDTNRALYFFEGSALQVGATAVPPQHLAELRPEFDAPLVAGPDTTQVLVLQGRPIGEPVVQYGPFVMNTADEIRQAYADYQRSQFGGWPWSRSDPVHAPTEGRFARHTDGRVERAG